MLPDRTALEAALADGAPPLELALRGFELALGRRSKFFSWAKREPQLLRALARADRYGLPCPDDPPERPAGLIGLRWLLDRMENVAELERAIDHGRLVDEGIDRPATLAWFIVRLDSETKRWRHTKRCGRRPGRAKWGEGRCRCERPHYTTKERWEAFVRGLERRGKVRRRRPAQGGLFS